MSSLERPDAEASQDRPLEFARTGLENPLQAPLRAIVHRFADGAATPAQHAPLKVFEEVLSGGGRFEEIDARLRALSHQGYLRGALVVLAAHLLLRPDARLALRVAEELCDALDEAAGMDLAGAVLRLDEVRAGASSPGSHFLRANALIADTYLHRLDHEAAARHFDAVLAIDVDHARALHGWTRCMEALEARGQGARMSGRGLAMLEGLEAAELAGHAGLERYELGRPLGRGRHAVVYEAFDRQVGREVAIKRLLGRSARKDKVSDRVVDRHFFAEARTLARVRSAHVVSLYDVQPRHRFVALELCRGGNLRVAMRRRRVGAEDLPRIGDELGAALRAVHAAKALHRDVKPANILLREAGPQSPIALADFGVAAAREQARTRAGTLRYLAPEVRAGEPATEASDLFSAGVVLLELATHPAPLPERLDRLGEGEDLREAVGALPVPGAWRERLGRLLDPDPEARIW